MERSLFRYIFQHTWRNQVLLLIVTALSFPLIYVNLAIPKEIVNNAIGGKHIPKTVLGFEVTQISYLMALSFLLLALITLNGMIKYWLNVYSGVIGERALRRMRHDLYQQVLRFPLPQFKTMSSGEIIPMIVAETDPIGGFIGESISLPAFQGGLLVTYMVFIFMQDFWLGLAAVALYPPQVWLIPRLQKKINLLSKERVQQARQLSDKIGETVAGAAEIRSNDTFHRERADISDRLGRIYAIRFDIFKRKFFVKFLNNFLGQITPFFFYSVGGYLVIQGHGDPNKLTLGALVAVLAAYKDILAPWKELLTWYSTKEDIRIKYEQIVTQFEPPGMIDAKLMEEPPAAIPSLSGDIAVSGLVYAEDGGANRVDRVSFNAPAAAHIARSSRRLHAASSRAASKRCPVAGVLLSSFTMRAATSSGRARVAGSASGMAAACIAVSISPGSIEMKRTPLSASSAAQMRDRWSSAAFDTPYAPQRGYAFVAASELTCTTSPCPRSSMLPTTALLSRNGPSKFTSSTRAKSSQAVSSNSGSGVGPSELALCTRMSIGPTSAAAAPAIG